MKAIKIVTSDEITILDKVILPASTVNLRSDGIIHIELHPLDEITAKDTWDIFETVKKIGGGKKFPNLITSKEYFSVHKDAREISACEESNLYTLADAFVVTSIALKLIANFYVSFNKPVRPTKLFNSEEKAVEWLYTFL